MWIAALLATPVVQAQEAWSETQYKARMGQMESWAEGYGLQLAFIARGSERYSGTTALRAELKGLPTRPGRDYAKEAALASLDLLDALAAEHYQPQRALLTDTSPRDADQQRYEATYTAVLDKGFEALMLVEKGDAKVLAQYNTRLITKPPTVYEHGTLGLPGPASSLALDLRQNFAVRHYNELYYLIRDARELAIRSTNDGLSAAEVPQVQERFGELLQRAEAVPPWMGDDTMVVAARREIRSLRDWSVRALPEQIEARDVQQDADAYNALVRTFNDRHVENVRRWAVAHEAFAVAWKIPDDSGVKQNWSNYHTLAAQVGVRRPESVRLDALQELHGAYQQLSYDMQQRLSAGEDPQAIMAEAGQKLDVLDAELRALEDPEFQDDPYQAQIWLLSELVHWKIEEVAPETSALVMSEHPRDADQLRLEVLYVEEVERTERVLDALDTSQIAYSKLYDLNLIGASEETTVATDGRSLSFPGPDSQLPDHLRAALAAGHSWEVWNLWYEADEALVKIVESPAVQWRRVTLKEQPVIDQALADAQQVPPWMGDSTLVDAAVEALGILSSAMTDHWPTVLVVLDEPGFRNRRASRRALGVTWALYEEAAGLMDEAYERYSQAWHLDLLEDEGAAEQQGWSGQQ